MSQEQELSPLKKALLAVQELKARLAASEAGRREPVAVVGLGMRLPGGVRTLDQLAQVLGEGRDLVGEVPPDRWDPDALPAHDGRPVPRHGGFLHDVAGFEPGFFGISPGEATEMDPAQRLLLEVAWEAFESAGLPPDQQARSRTGVYVGLGLSDYGRRHFLSADLDRLGPYSGTGSFLSVAAGRISYTLGLQGPAVTVDTACSSSLVAIHLAMQALRSGECDLALAGGANLILAPEPTVYFSRLQALSPTGRCHTFDAAADGYIRGEGAGLVLLARLRDAVARGLPVLGVLHGSAVNQDGRTNGLTAPSSRAQAEVLRQALASAGWTASDVDYVEAHGTGTPLGDPIEFEALRQVYGSPRPDGRPLRVGSVKTNLGHLETAAGVAGLFKALVALRGPTVPPHLHLRQLNPRIRLEGSRLQVNTAPEPWGFEGPRRAGISSFGLSGTNAHLLVEAAPEVPAPAPADGPALLVFSARTPAAARVVARELVETLEGSSLPAVARSWWQGRASLGHRVAVVAADARSAARALSSFALGESTEGVQAGDAAARPLLAVLFTGQGAQRLGAGAALYRQDEVFRAAWEEVEEAFAPHLDRRLADVAFGSDADLLNDTGWTQPVLFALEWSLWRWWSARGIEPEVLVGHSIGELVAAAAAEVFSLADAARLVAARARLMSALPRGGAMLAAFAPLDVVQAELPAGVDLAGLNGPTETVLSGPAEAIGQAEARLSQRGVKTRRLVVSHAFHSAQMDAMLPAFAEVARSLTYQPARLPIASNRTGRLETDALARPEYWVDQVRHAVRFADGIEAAYAEGARVFLELGPRAVLVGMGARVLGERSASLLASMDPEGDEVAALWRAAGGLYVSGAAVDLGAVLPAAPRVALPLTPWQHERFWMDPPRLVSAQTERLGALEQVWRPLGGRPTLPAGSWRVQGSPELAEALRALGATILPEGSPDHWLVEVEPAPEALDAGWVAAQVGQLQRALAQGGRVWVLSRGAVSPSSPGAGAARAGWGWLRTVAVERPAQAGGALDLAEGVSLADGLRWLGGTPGEIVAVRPEGALVSRLAASTRPAGSEMRFGGTWLLTGGTGALGREIARYLAQAGVSRLILASRRGSLPDGELAALRALGAQVEVLALDLVQAEEVAALVAQLPDLEGVVHAAGVVDDAPLAAVDAERLARVIGPKVGGLAALDAALAQRRDVLVVAVGSASASLGVPGQAAYAAANAALEGWAEAGRRVGRKTMVLAYAPLSVGMGEAVGPAVQRQWAAEGIGVMSPSAALAPWPAWLGGRASCLVVAPFDWERYVATRPGPAPWLGELAKVDGPSGGALAAELLALPPGGRRKALVERVAAVAGSLLGLVDGQRLDPQLGFFDAGLDSLLAMELRARLQALAGLPLSATLAFDHPNAEAVGDHLLHLLGLAEATSEAAALPAARAEQEDLAVVGAACRFPGGAEDLETFWALLRDGVDAVGPVPRERFDVERYFDPQPATPGKLSSRDGGFIRGIEDFDPVFFGMSPREGATLDPQQRLLLETAWQALERATLAPASLAETAVGVYVGIGFAEYGRRFSPTAGDPETDLTSGTGNETSFAAGRVAYTLGVRGPALAVNTACSSSLVALHLAAKALRDGECAYALAGGVNAIVGPETTIQVSQLRALAPDGRCKAFDHRANGYVRSEGVGMVVLTRLSRAQALGLPILAVLRGTAVNHDGRSAGLTVPSGPAQQEVLRAALRDARLAPEDLDLVECHGTGTALGDPIEVRALGAVLAPRPDRPVPLRISSVKTNLGHLEAGAGIAGFLKVVASLQHEAVPPHLHLERPNPALPLQDHPIHLPTTLEAWPRGARPRRAGVSSFGISGTNAHVILEEAPLPAEVDRRTTRPAHLLLLSTRGPDALRQLAADLADDLEASPERPLVDTALSLAIGRSPLEHRAAVVAAHPEQAVALLRRVADGRGTVGRASEAPRLAFLCTGAGPQEVGMARRLYDTEPVFRAALDECARLVDPHLDVPLLKVLYPAEGEGSPLHELAYTQPAMFALEWSLAQLWKSWGVEPDAVIGHSTGQYPAAALAGVFSLEDGLRLMAVRARLMNDQPRIGAMVACFTTEDRVAKVLAGQEEHLSIAAINGPAEVVISGLAGPVEAAAAALEAEGIEVRRLNISHAAHSPLMRPILDRFREVVASVPLSAPRIPLIDNVTGQVLTPAQAVDPEHWTRHLAEAVRFADGIDTLARMGFRHFLELGNHPILSGAGARCLEGREGPPARWFPTLRRQTDDWEQLLETAGRLFTEGVVFDAEGLHRHAPGARVALPTTPFQRRRCWVDRVEPTAASVGDSWIYEESWEEVPLPGAAGSAPLVLVGGGGWAEGLAARLDRPVVRWTHGAASRRGAVWSLDLTDAAAVEAALTDSGAAGLVHLAGLEDPGAVSASDAAFPVAASALACLRAASARRARVLLVSRGVKGPGTPTGLHQAPLDGLFRVAALELPELQVARLDLDPNGADPLGELARALEGAPGEDQLALRQGRAFAPRLVRASLPPEAPPLADGRWWITGGVGALGRVVGRWLLDRGVRSLVLTGRRAPGGEAADELAAWRQAGAEVTFVAADLAAPGEAARVLAGLRSSDGPPLTGVVHAAGVLDDASLLALDPARLRGVWGPKVDATAALIEALEGHPLQALVFFSSAAAMVGSPGQANYASGNAWMDAAAQVLRARGVPAVSLGWGAWGEVGLATTARRSWEEGGVRPMAPHQAVQVFGRALGGSSARLVVADVDWERFGARLGRIPSLLRGQVAPAVAAPPPVSEGLLTRLQAIPSLDRPRRLTEQLAEVVGEILGLRADEVDPELGFFDAGMDSLMAVELVSRLKALFGVSLPATLAFDHPNLVALVRHLLGQVLVFEEPVSGADLPAAPPASLEEPLAIVGVACRFPGGASSPESFFELLRAGIDPMIEVPPDRWDLAEYYDPTPATPGKMYVREAGFVDGVDQFDPEFFNLSPREAASMDPQQRLMLEVAWEALERAHLTNTQLRGSRLGVFVGAGSSGYLQRFQEAGGPLYRDTYAGTGSLEAFVSGRVAYILGVHGPNLALNTACSSSLVALHLAAQALRTGDCDAALAGGVHLMLSPENFVYVSQLRALSPSGRCHTFDAAADGYGRSEGCGLVVLKRLSDAQRAGDRILALLRGTAVNHDGPSSGLTVPYGPAQQQVLRAALQRSGVDPHEVSYVEAHGTGTVLGDPIEVHAIEAEYCRGRGPDRPLYLGAVKANVGHMEVAAASAGLVKLVMMLQRQELVPQIHFRTPNPDLSAINASDSPLRVTTKPLPWASPGPRRAGLSAFGLAGTNGHALLEEAPPYEPPPAPTVDREAFLLPLSARQPEALRALAVAYGERLEGSASLPDVAWSAAVGRMPFEHRLAVVAPDAARARARLAQWLAEGQAPGVSQAQAAGRRPRVAFLFSGQGSQWPGMTRELAASSQVIGEALDACAAVLDPLLGVPLREVLHAGPDDPRVHDTRFTQPCLFAVEYALACFWRDLGLDPEIVVGHSVGELVAATLAGVFDLPDALRLVAARGRLMAELPREGSMLAVFAPEAEVSPLLVGREAELSIAAVNNPSETVLSGRSSAVAEVAAALTAAGVEHKALVVSHAFHSPLLDPMLDAFEAIAATLTMRPPRSPLLSNLTGQLAGPEVATPGYWRRHVREAVRFQDSCRTLDELGYQVFLEVGPHPTLLGNLRRAGTGGRDAALLPSLRRAEPEWSTLLAAAGALWARGVPLDLGRLDLAGRARVDLPPTPFLRRRIWMNAPEWPARPDPIPGWLVAPGWWAREAGPAEVAGRIWLVPDRAGQAEALMSELVRRGAVVELKSELPSALPEDLRAIVFLPGLEARVEPSAEGVRRTTVALWQWARLAAEAARPPRLVALTRAAVEAGGAEVLAPAAQSLWGLMRVVRLEAAALRARAVDLPAEGAPPEVVVDLLLSEDDEPEVVWRGGERRVARLERVPSPVRPALGAEGSWLLTGGLGGLGLELARWLVDQGVRTLVLNGRRPPSEAAAAVIDALRARGARVEVALGDSAVAADLDRVMSVVDQLGEPLVGVVHAAGVLADAALARLDEEKFQRVAAPKLLGTWNLHRATLDRPLRYFVLFSGGASLMGSPGQANYAAANAYLDGFAAWRRARGLPAVAINWGAWAEVGMAARLGEGHAGRQAREGIEAIPLRKGFEAMARLLASDRAQVGVLPVDWARFVEVAHRGHAPPFLRLLVQGAAQAAPTVVAAGAGPAQPSAAAPGAPVDGDLRAALAGLRGDDRLPVVQARVERAARKVLGLEAGAPIDPTRPLIELGLDSLLAVELKNALMDAGVDVPVARVMTGPPIEVLNRLVLNVLDAEAPRPEATPTAGGALEDLPDHSAALPDASTPPLPFNPVLTHLLAMLLGMVLLAGLYLLGTAVSAEQPAPKPAPTVEEAPKGGKKPPKR